MIKLEKTTKTNLKAKGLQVVNNEILDPEAGEVINIPLMVQNAFGEGEYFDFTFTTSVKEESEVDTGEREEIPVEDLMD